MAQVDKWTDADRVALLVDIRDGRLTVDQAAEKLLMGEPDGVNLSPEEMKQIHPSRLGRVATDEDIMRVVARR